MRQELEGERESIQGKLREQEAVMQEALLSQCAGYSVDYNFIFIEGLIFFFKKQEINTHNL